jgi:hypothetical protein
MPILSAGKHRNPRQGACFMEFASYLAGEKWSDHPACTHALIATLARDVNDLTSDAARSRLMPLVGRVVGLTSVDPLLGPTIAMRAASAALPIVSMERQRALAAGMLSILARVDSVELEDMAAEAFTHAPDSERWARRYLASSSISPRNPDRANEAIVHTAAIGIALACLPDDEPDSDARLAMLLEDVITACETKRTVHTEARVPALV